MVDFIQRKKTLLYLHNWFENYTNSFAFENPEDQRSIHIKKEHIKRVRYEILDIGKSLRLSEEDLHIAEIIALFHDIGRFEQLRRYKTLMDAISENHAFLGLKVLKKHHVLKNIPTKTQKIVLYVIAHHNRIIPPQKGNQKHLFFSKLIRDADKLDIWRFIIEHYRTLDGKISDIFVFELPDSPGISHEIYSDIMAGKSVHIKSVKNLNDLKLLQMGWIYDINFRRTFQKIRDREYIEELCNVLPQSEKTSQVFLRVKSYLKNNC